jgi:hypothetical protein
MRGKKWCEPVIWPIVRPIVIPARHASQHASVKIRCRQESY